MTRTEAAWIADALRAEHGPGAACGATATWARIVDRLGPLCERATAGQFTRADFACRARQQPLFEDDIEDDE